MSKKCFVIMPYGGNDDEKRKHFLGVYQSIILPAARQAGYECKRSDMAAEPGNITHDIVRDLADADIVIADLTNANANVFFELGIRHAFRKSGTVHLIDRDHKLPFDIQQYRAFEYSVHLADIPDAIEGIIAAIDKREANPERPDNPVHDAIPELPISAMSVGDNALRHQLQVSEQHLLAAQQEVSTLRGKLAELDPGGSIMSPGSNVNIDALLDQADEIMQFTGQHALLRLREAADKGGADEFVKELRKILQSPYLDQNDFMEIVILCRKLGLYGHRRATLDVAMARYPNSEEMFLALIDALDDSPNPKDQERGRKLIEDRLGIVLSDGQPKLVAQKAAFNLPSRMSIGLLFNFYQRANRPDWIIAVVDQALAALSHDMHPLLLRNKARAQVMTGRYDDARATFEESLSLDPNDDTTMVWYSDLLERIGDFTGAYELGERAITADPDDARLLIHLAIQIFNKGYVRNESGTIQGPLPKAKALPYGIPLILEAVERRGNDVTLVEEAVRVLVRAGAVEVASEISRGTLPNAEKYKTSALEYVRGLLDKPAVAHPKVMSGREHR